MVRGDPDDYADRHPGPGDVSLVVEVSDATLQGDRTLKKQLYAQAGIPVYWIANLPQGQLEVYSDPSTSTDPADYRVRRVYGMEEELDIDLPGVEAARLRIRDLIPG